MEYNRILFTMSVNSTIVHVALRWRHKRSSWGSFEEECRQTSSLYTWEWFHIGFHTGGTCERYMAIEVCVYKVAGVQNAVLGYIMLLEHSILVAILSGCHSKNNLVFCTWGRVIVTGWIDISYLLTLFTCCSTLLSFFWHGIPFFMPLITILYLNSG